MRGVKIKRGVNKMDLRGDALQILKDTSRTFYIPISILPSGLPVIL